MTPTTGIRRCLTPTKPRLRRPRHHLAESQLAQLLKQHPWKLMVRYLIVKLLCVHSVAVSKLHCVLLTPPHLLPPSICSYPWYSRQPGYEGGSGARIAYDLQEKEKKGSLSKAPEPVMGRDTKVTKLTPIQAGTYAFLTEYVRSMTHAIGPQDPPVQPFLYTGRGPLDACRALHSMYECRALILHATHLTLIAFVVTIPTVSPPWHWLIKRPVART